MSALSFQASQKIVVLEGLDGTGKSALAKTLIHSLNGRAVVMHFEAASDLKVATLSRKALFDAYNTMLTDAIPKNPHEVIILDRSWLSGEASRYAKKRNQVNRWPDQLYRPTHLFILTLPEEERLRHLSLRLNDKPATKEELRLQNDPQYRQDYETGLREGAQSLRLSTIIRELDGSQLSIQQMADKIISLLDCNRSLLDPRKLATGDKISLRGVYQSWVQRLNSSHLPPEYIKILPEAENGVDFSETIRQKHQCHFDNIGKVFDYNAFSQPRHLPVPIGFLENKDAFDHPFADHFPQAQDMPISFPTSSAETYEYRLPECYSNLSEFVKKVATVWHQLEPKAHEYYAYLSVSHSLVIPWVSQRRPTIHCDGFQSSRIDPKERNEYTFVAANALPTVFYPEAFDVSDLDPSRDNFFIAFSKRTAGDPVDCAKPYEILMMDPYCMHAAIANTGDEAVSRTFARIIYSTREYDRLGNTHNYAFDYSWKMVRREAQQDLADSMN